MMGEYTISKALNNNVIICTYNNQEVILIEKVLALIKGGMTLDESASIEKVYKLEQNEQEYYKSLVEIADEDVLQAIIESVNFITSTTHTTDDKTLLLH